MYPTLSLIPQSEFSAALWAKRERTEQNMHDLDALSRSLIAIEPLALPDTSCDHLVD